MITIKRDETKASYLEHGKEIYVETKIHLPYGNQATNENILKACIV